MTPTETFHLFVDAINAHDPSALSALMAPDHVFIDSVGHRIEGPAAMVTGWRSYFSMCPDYWIRLTDTLSDGPLILAAGMAGGTLRATSWQTPAAFKALIQNDKVAEWRVFADNKPVYEILARQ
ncbi:MAG: nuclear transport factor 2 family protein [Acidobacteriota bacterium]